uniref:Uncharacterized protein n=1 Tax=Rhizophora mucronata TaxID=61149 RepID=A0A2P2QLY1_RHIMU
MYVQILLSWFWVLKILQQMLLLVITCGIAKLLIWLIHWNLLAQYMCQIQSLLSLVYLLAQDTISELFRLMIEENMEPVNFSSQLLLRMKPLAAPW